MAAVDDNKFPKLIFAETTTPSSPAASHRTLWVDANKVLWWKSAAGLDSPLAALNKWDATAAPGVTNDVDEGYSVGSRWIDVTNDKEYVCLDATDGAAVWTETTQAGGGGAGTLLALKEEKAAHTYSTTSETLADVDATNMAVTFTAPASGNILVRLTAYCDTVGATSAFGRWSLRESTTDIPGAGGSVSRDVDDGGVRSIAFKLTGVTGGAHTYKWSYKTTIAGDAHRILVGAGGDDQPPAVTEIWELA